MKPSPRISETEWEIMRIIWSKGTASAGDVIVFLQALNAGWHPKTIKTFLGRLVAKGALGFRKEGRAYVYYPLVEEKDSVTAASENFLQRVFGGSLKPMLAHFVEHKKLSNAEIRELKKLLDQGK